MKLLAELSEESVGAPVTGEILGRNFKLRKSARGIILNDKNEVSLQHVTKNEYYKLPGGGVDPGETVEEALRREIIEEVGCNITIEKEIGVTIEYRTMHDLLHISYGYIGRVDGPVGEPAYEQGEIDDGFVPVWIPLKDSLQLVEDNPGVDKAQVRFMVAREKIFLTEAVRVLGV